MLRCKVSRKRLAVVGIELPVLTLSLMLVGLKIRIISQMTAKVDVVQPTDRVNFKALT